MAEEALQADEALQTVTLRDEFYRDGFGRVVAIFIGIFVGIGLLVAVSIYFYMNKPPPITFPVSEEWRVQPDIPLSQPYRTVADLLQWASDTAMEVFTFDFNSYNDQLKNTTQYFTQDGWSVFLNQLNIYANYNTVQTDKLFVNATPTGAPSLINQGVVSGRYSWIVQIPVEISYVGIEKADRKSITLQLTIVRVPTLNNLTGLGIDDVVVLADKL